MISSIFGLPGSGKTLLLSYIASRAVEGKKINFHGLKLSTCSYDRVYTNFPFPGAYELVFDTLGVLYYHDCLILIDEIQLFADSRNFKNFDDRLKWFFSMHRHMHIDIVYCSQSFDNVDRRIRSLTDRLYYLDTWYFNMLRVRAILSYFDVSNGSINEGYEYCNGFNASYFYRPRLYKYCDSWAMIKDPTIKKEPLKKWETVVETAQK